MRRTVHPRFACRIDERVEAAARPGDPGALRSRQDDQTAAVAPGRRDWRFAGVMCSFLMDDSSGGATASRAARFAAGRRAHLDVRLQRLANSASRRPSIRSASCWALGQGITRDPRSFATSWSVQAARERRRPSPEFLPGLEDHDLFFQLRQHVAFGREHVGEAHSQSCGNLDAREPFLGQQPVGLPRLRFHPIADASFCLFLELQIEFPIDSLDQVLGEPVLRSGSGSASRPPGSRAISCGSTRPRRGGLPCATSPENSEWDRR